MKRNDSIFDVAWAQSDDRIQRKHSHALDWKLISFVPIYLHVNVRWLSLVATKQPDFV